MSSASRCQSNCPITGALDLLGDKWTLVVLRDLLMAGKTHFGDLASYEGIATNVLTERLERLERAGVITKERDPGDGRKRIYRPTSRGADLIPVLLDLALWGAEHTANGTAHAELVADAREDRDAVIAAIRRSLGIQSRH